MGITCSVTLSSKEEKEGKTGVIKGTLEISIREGSETRGGTKEIFSQERTDMTITMDKGTTFREGKEQEMTVLLFEMKILTKILITQMLTSACRNP